MDNRRKKEITAITLVLTLALSGCNLKEGEQLEFTENENNELVAIDDSYISSANIKDYYVIEAYNTVKKIDEIYIAKAYSLKQNGEIYYKYYDVFSNQKIVSTIPGEETLLSYVKATPLEDYIVALDMAQLKYSYDDIKNIYETIKEYYVFDNDKSLRRTLTNNRI